MITAVYRPRKADLLLIDPDANTTFPVPAAQIPDLLEAMADAFAVPLLAARLAGDPRPIPERTFWSAV